jgi:TPR repeat protein
MRSFKRNPAAQACLALSLMLAQSVPWALPETSSTPAAPSTLDAVKVNAQRNGGVDPSIVIAAKNKVLSHLYASSCGFIYGSGPDDVTLNYMRDFHPGGDPLLGVYVDDDGHMVFGTDQRFSDYAPGGDASMGQPLENPSVTDALSGSAGCGAKDKRFASGRNWIARKDKSLTQAIEAYEAGNYAEARIQFEKGWNKVGYEEAALMLGRLHLQGLGTPASTPQAIEWLHKVVDARYDPIRDRLRFDASKPEVTNTRIDAALLLARIQLTGQGTARNPAEAYKWWRKALDFGYEPAGTLLAQAHLSGIGAPVDVKAALAYLQAASDAGDANARYLLGQLYHHQVPRQPDGVPLDLNRAGAYYSAAARAGHVGATYAAARMLDLGEGTAAPAPERAVVLYRDAALKGHPDAQNALATYFYSGEVVEKNFATARQFFKAAAERQQPDAMFNLAVMLARGQGGDKDLATAYAWCSLSQRLGNEQAAVALPAIAAQLSPEQKSRADALLKPTKS